MSDATNERLDEAERRLLAAQSDAANLSKVDVDEAYKAIQAARFALKRVAVTDRRENRFKVLQLFVQALIPLSVAFLAWQLPLQQKLADQELARVAVVPDLMDDLFSGDPKKEQLSVRVIRLVLKEEGDALLAGLLSSANLPPTVREAILDATLQSTIDGLFDAPRRSDRQDFYDTLKYRQTDKGAVIRGLVSKALTRPQDDDGVYNAAQLLSQMTSADLKLEADLLTSAIPMMAKNGTKTAELLAIVQQKIAAP